MAFVICILDYCILHLLSCVYICLCFRTQLIKEEPGPHSHPHPCSHWFHANIHDFNRAFILESEKCFVFHAKYRESEEGKKMSDESVCKGRTVCRTCSWTMLLSIQRFPPLPPIAKDKHKETQKQFKAMLQYRVTHGISKHGLQGFSGQRKPKICVTLWNTLFEMKSFKSFSSSLPSLLCIRRTLTYRWTG